MILSDADLITLTRRTRRSAQQRVLKAIGVPFRLRPDGSIVVFEKDLNASPEKRQASPTLRLPPPRRVLAGEARKMDTPRR